MSRIFIVEDDPDVRMSIAEILIEEGYEVREFATGSETLRELRAGVRPCIVLVDLLMPEMSGQEFLNELHRDSTLEKIPVVMITGAKTTFTDVEVLRKPFDLSDLIATVNRYCRPNH